MRFILFSTKFSQVVEIEIVAEIDHLENEGTA
jgi:hypothetical protein